MISSKGQAGFAVLIFLGMVFVIFLFATPVIFALIGIHDPSGVTGFVLKLSPAVILSLIVVRAFSVVRGGGFLG